MEVVKLTKEEREWLLNLLQNMQIHGTLEQARQQLAVADAIMRKLKGDE